MLNSDEECIVRMQVATSQRNDHDECLDKTSPCMLDQAEIQPPNGTTGSPYGRPEKDVLPTDTLLAKHKQSVVGR